MVVSVSVPPATSFSFSNIWARSLQGKTITSMKDLDEYLEVYEPPMPYGLANTKDRKNLLLSATRRGSYCEFGG